MGFNDFEKGNELLQVPTRGSGFQSPDMGSPSARELFMANARSGFDVGGISASIDSNGNITFGAARTESAESKTLPVNPSFAGVKDLEKEPVVGPQSIPFIGSVRLPSLEIQIPRETGIGTRMRNATSGSARELEDAMRDVEPAVRSAAARNGNATAEQLSVFATDESRLVRASAASNRNTSAQDLNLLATDKDSGVRATAARNGNLPLPTLKAMASDESADVREAVATSNRLPPIFLKMLADDAHPAVQTAVAWNSNTPPETLDQLSKGASYFVRDGLIHNQLTGNDALARMARVSGTIDLKSILAHENAGREVFGARLADPDPAFRRVIAESRRTPADMLEILSRDSDEQVRNAALANARSSRR